MCPKHAAFWAQKAVCYQGGWKLLVLLRQSWMHFQAAPPKRSHRGFVVSFLHNSCKAWSINIHMLYFCHPSRKLCPFCHHTKGIFIWHKDINFSQQGGQISPIQRHPTTSIIGITLYELLLRSNIWVYCSATTFILSADTYPLAQKSQTVTMHM